MNKKEILDLGIVVRRIGVFVSTVLQCGVLLFTITNLGVAQTKPKTAPIEIAGISVTPHVRAETKRDKTTFGKTTEAFVRLFLRNTAIANTTVFTEEVTFEQQTPQKLQALGKWTWHDTPVLWETNDAGLPAGAITVWAFHGKQKPYTIGGKFTLAIEDKTHGTRTQLPVRLDAPTMFVSSVTFLSSDGDMHPDTLIFHLINNSQTPLTLKRTRIYLPTNASHTRYFVSISSLVGNELVFNFEKISRQDLLRAGERNAVQPFPESGEIAAKKKGGAKLITGKLPLTDAVLEVEVVDERGKVKSVWAKVRIKLGTFDPRKESRTQTGEYSRAKRKTASINASQRK